MMSFVRKYTTALAVLVLSSCNAHAAGPQVPAAGSLTGRVASADGKPLAGVVVSDGVRVTQTDTEGMYTLDSDKELGYVFISIPSGYMTAADACAIPQFFARTAKPAGQSERHDFTLTPVDNTRHTVIAATDHHLADRESLDVTQFTAEGGFIDDVKAVAAATASPVYSICMGDMSWDEYWHKRNFMLPGFRRLYERYTFPCPVFNAMGNHDNDPYCASDEAASAAFRREIGPTYYSFNLGQLHYVVLDNIVYVNTGGREGAIGKLDYEVRIDDRQLAWLRADLATVADKSAPLIIVMHAQLHWWYRGSEGVSWKYAFTRDAGCLVDALAGFSEVHLVTGHSHMNFRLLSGDERHMVVDRADPRRLHDQYLPRRFTRGLRGFRSRRTRHPLALQGHRARRRLPVPGLRHERGAEKRTYPLFGRLHAGGDRRRHERCLRRKRHSREYLGLAARLDRPRDGKRAAAPGCARHRQRPAAQDYLYAQHRAVPDSLQPPHVALPRLGAFDDRPYRGHRLVRPHLLGDDDAAQSVPHPDEINPEKKRK